MQVSYSCAVFERYVDIRSIPSTGRSINLVLTSRGLNAIMAIDPSGKLAQELADLSTPVTGRIIHNLDGERIFQRYVGK